MQLNISLLIHSLWGDHVVAEGLCCSDNLYLRCEVRGGDQCLLGDPVTKVK